MIKIQCENLTNECYNMFYESSERFESEGGIFEI